MSKVEFGSVRFFRRAITSITAIVIIGLVVGLVIVTGKLNEARADLNYYRNESVVGTTISEMGNQSSGEIFDYERLFPNLYVTRSSEYTRVYDAERFFYLTFTGGPSDRTEEILKVLRDKGVKATFFVSGGDSESGKAIMQKIVEEGHTIGVYNYSAPQQQMYESVESYLDDFEHEFRVIYDATGTKPTVFRFAGGTTNKYNVLIREGLAAEMLRRGFTYYDWNATGGDNIPGATTESIYENAINTCGEKQRIFLNLHDSGEMFNTAEALGRIIDYYLDKGYEFDAITNSVRPVTFD